MKQNNKKHILFRYVLIIIATLIFAIAIIYKMSQTTIVHAAQWNDKAKEILASEIVVQPERGNIYAADGSLIAANLHYYTARLDFGADNFNPDSLRKMLPEITEGMSQILTNRTKKEWNAFFEKSLKRKSGKRSIRLATQLTLTQYRMLKDLPFFNKRKNRAILYSEYATRRVKPYGAMASRSIGNVGIRKNGEIHGTSGLEMALDSLLYGIPGKAHKIQVTNSLVNWETVPAQRGYDIKTTIDVNIQDIVEEELNQRLIDTNAEWGTAIVMEVATGEIKAISNLEWNNTYQQYMEGANNAVRGYEPGSVIKLLSMIVAMEDGLVPNINQEIVTGSSFIYASRKVSDGQHGRASMPIRGIIESSSNVGICKLLLPKYGPHPGEYYHRLKELGIFEPLRTGIGGEQSFHTDSLGEKNWDRVALSRVLYGYTTSIPPMNTLAIYNAVANNGKFVRPRLVKEFMRNGVTDSIVPVTYIRDQICSPENAAKLRTMLHDVVWGDHGTAKALRNDYVEIAGKTGTAFCNANGRYNGKKRLAFCGFFPFNNPKYTCMVLMSNADRGAALSSGTVLKNVALKLYARGMLDNVSDYKAEVENGPVHRAGRLYATNDPKALENMKQNFGLKNTTCYRTPENYSKGKVPSAIGLGLKDAIARMERAGLNVSFSGLGYVVQQNIAPGTPVRKGATIMLTLKE